LITGCHNYKADLEQANITIQKQKQTIVNKEEFYNEYDKNA